MQYQTTHPIQTHQLLLPARAAIYARVSSDQQAERQTIGSQVSDLLARAATDGRDIGEEFRFLDDGQSGASLVQDRKSTRLNSSHQIISYAVFCLKKKKKR